MKKLVRTEKDRMLGGVCGGLAQYFNIDPVLVRLAFVLLTIYQGSGLLLYFILLILMPLDTEVEATQDVNDLQEER
ncbi:MAG: PspC domain-containing protein [Anaerolineales bacterium]|nr:PspC domain-containing protein [Anaerolineales bacterium]